MNDYAGCHITGSHISCGMYALGNEINLAWHKVLGPLPQILKDHGIATALPEAEVSFAAPATMLVRPDLLIGHTCGYPWIKRWHQSHTLVAVPEFNADGATGIHYCSWIISGRNSSIDSIAESRGGIVAINGQDSNSGMNVLRYEISKLANGQKFFNQTRLTGSHLESLRMIAVGKADIAAIDCVSMHFFRQLLPELVSRVKIIGASEKTAGLPFILPQTPQTLNIPATTMADALEQCISKAPSEALSILSLKKFTRVRSEDYMRTAELEDFAISGGYPQLR